MLVHDIIKIKYVNLGYIRKNYPYHLISDEEMFGAFINFNSEFTSSLIDPDVRFFDMYYPNPFAEHDYIYQRTKVVIDPDTGEPKTEVVSETSLSGEYTKLKEYIIEKIKEFLQYSDTADAANHQLPDWIYTYMLGEVVYQQSDYLDIQDTLALLGCSNIDNEFTREACIQCYITSLKYISTLTAGIRPPTIFGEPHVIKQLRLET